LAEETAVANHGTKSGQKAVRILIVDDHPVVREGLAVRIARQPDLEICGEAASISEALAQIDEKDPDVAIIDLSLKEGDGLDLIRRIRARNSRVCMLVWSMYPETMFADRALSAGAMGYINKQEATSRIMEAIRCVSSGRVYLSGPMADRLLQRSIGGGLSIGPAPIESLSDRELEVFRLIGEGRTTAEVAAQLHRSMHTIETYRQRIKTKLGIRNAAELARAAVQWVLENG
jgi:DNA-binding NarL/FixJ family response regulator